MEIQQVKDSLVEFRDVPCGCVVEWRGKFWFKIRSVVADISRIYTATGLDEGDVFDIPPRDLVRVVKGKFVEE